MNRIFTAMTRTKIMIFAACAVILPAALALFLIFVPAGTPDKEPVRVYIEYGSGFNSAAEEIKAAGAVRSSFVFKAYAVLTGNRSKIKAGEYEFLPSDSMAAILDKLVRGDVIKYRVVIPEGSEIRDMAVIIEKEGLGSAQEFVRLANDREFLKGEGIEYKTAEGLLFPDTYYFIRGTGEKKMLQAMLARFREKVTINLKAKYDVQGLQMTGYYVLKLASLIEKESKLDEERPKVASVFINRLKSTEAYQKKLESCATVRYALNKKTGALTYRDLRADSPYNTYIYIGLPPSPICSPGLKSIEAALKPSETKYRYFVVRDEGEHTFSETLEQHNAAKNTNKKLRNSR